MLNIYVFCVVILLIINLKINNLHGASFNKKDLNFLENQLQRSIRQTNVDECVPPTILNGNINIIKRKSTKKRNFLSLNVTCDNNYILQPPSDFFLSCFNGFWDVDEIPECKRCVKRTKSTTMEDDTNSQLTCPESLYENRIYTDCGQRIDRTHQPFVVSGTVSKFAEFPWHVGIYKKDQNDADPTYHCGGSIINEKHILTVAHCLSDAYGKTITSREYYAAAGKYHRNYITDRETTQRRKIIKTYLHPRYQGELTNYAWDIAIITVHESFQISVLVHPVCIDWKSHFENDHLSPDKYGEVAGWGKTEIDINKPASELRVLRVPFIDDKQCNKFVPSTFVRYITHDKFCAGYMNGSSVCDGDSGGGLVFEREEKGKTKYYIRGLVSVGLQTQGRCDEYKYSTYTKISEYIPFIQESIQNKDNSTIISSVSITSTLLPDSLKNPTETTVYCNTPNNETAKCISIYDCKIFVTALQNSPTTDMIKFMKDSVCGKQDEKKVCCGSTINYLSVIHSNPVTSKPIEHKNLNLLPTPGVCGIETEIRRRRIYGGTVAYLHDYPWMALLEYGTPEKSAGFLCAGSLINERYILTAAHCAIRIRSTDSAQLFRVRLGEHNLDTEVDCEGPFCADPALNVDVEQILIHPSYNKSLLINDIALLRLANNISYTDYVTPICLPLSGEMSVPGKQMLIAGWGKTEIGSYSSIKLKSSLYITSQEACNNIYKQYFSKIVSSHICATGEPGNGDCTGDTGGPLMAKLTNSNYIYAEGILSFGSRKCASSIPSVSTRVTTFMDWILETIKP